MTETNQVKTNETNGVNQESLMLKFESGSDLQLLADLGKTLTSTLSLHEVLSSIMEQVNAILQPKHWSLFMLDKSKKELYLAISQGDAAKSLKGFRLPLGDGISGWVALEGKPVLVPDVRYDRRFSTKADQITHFETKSIICVPLKNRNEVLGVIELINTDQEREFAVRDLNILLILADFAAIAIDNANNYKRVKRLSLKDPLTPTYNIRYLHHILDKWIRNASHFSIIFLDLDHFKQIVDTYGHMQGSYLLVEFSKFLNQRVLSLEKRLQQEGKAVKCSTIRYGGDEFIVLLKGVCKQEANSLSQTVLKDLAETEFNLENQVKIKLNASLGLGHFPEDATNKKDLMALTDSAMFQAKADGKGRVVLVKK